MSELPAIQLKNVVKHLDDRPVVDGVSFTVFPGRSLALLGPTGCGKTTILRLIAGLESPDRGKILINGRRVSTPSRQTPPYARGVGLVFQDLALWPHMTVWQNVAFVLDCKLAGRREKNRRIRRVLSQVRLVNRCRSYPHQLSGGEKQRLALARALAPDPEILLMDEPLSSLDIHLKKTLLPEVQALLHKLGTTLVYVTHQWREAVFMADHIARIKEGRVHDILPTPIFENRYWDRFKNDERFEAQEPSEPATVIPLKRSIM